MATWMYTEQGCLPLHLKPDHISDLLELRYQANLACGKRALIEFDRKHIANVSDVDCEIRITNTERMGNVQLTVIVPKMSIVRTERLVEYYAAGIDNNTRPGYFEECVMHLVRIETPA